MKKAFLIMIICLGIALNAMTQDNTKKDSVAVGNKEQNLAKKSDTTRIKLGNKGIAIVEDGSGTSVKVEDLEKSKDNDEDKDVDYSGDNDNKSDAKKHNHFKGHWAGFEFGMNNFMNKDFSLTRSAANGDQFMDLNTGRSWNVNINMFQHSFGFGTDIFGLVTGLGLEFNDYQFDGNNNITKDASGYTVSMPYVEDLTKTKVSTGYITLPLMLELQLPASAKNSKRVHLSAGVIGGLKMGSHTKVEFYDINHKLQKNVVKDDFNIRSLRYAFTGRIGYGNLSIFANYYASTFFEKNKGPELYPFAIGLALGM